MRKLTILLAVFGLVVVGCGSNGDTATGSTGKTTTTEGNAGPAPVKLDGKVNNHGTKDVADGASIEVEQDDYYFGPTFIKSTPGAKITIELRNEGDNQHTFTSDALGVDQTVDPGKTAKVEVTLPSSGASLFYCRFHHDKGMQGAFYFNDGDSVSGGIPSDDATTTTSNY
jgi:plastocyanin